MEPLPPFLRPSASFLRCLLIDHSSFLYLNIISLFKHHLSGPLLCAEARCWALRIYQNRPCLHGAYPPMGETEVTSTIIARWNEHCTWVGVGCVWGQVVEYGVLRWRHLGRDLTMRRNGLSEKWWKRFETSLQVQSLWPRKECSRSWEETRARTEWGWREKQERATRNCWMWQENPTSGTYTPFTKPLPKMSFRQR